MKPQTIGRLRNDVSALHDHLSDIVINSDADDATTKTFQAFADEMQEFLNEFVKALEND